MKRISKSIIIAVVLILTLSVLISCDEKESSPTPPSKPITVTIGYLGALSSTATPDYPSMALSDMIEFYNSQRIIPGVEFAEVTYNYYYNPDEEVPGYNNLKQNGADLIFTLYATTAESLKDYAKEDKTVVFSSSVLKEVITPPGYVYGLGTTPENEIYSLLQWIVENDPDFPKDRPARIGGAMWDDDYGHALLAGAEEYATNHSDKYEWVAGYLIDFLFEWTTEIEALSVCDYILTPAPPSRFIQQYRDAGHTGKLLGTNYHANFLSLIEKAQLWEEADEMLLVMDSAWWNDEGEWGALVDEVLNHCNRSFEEGTNESALYLHVMHDLYIIFGVIEDAVMTSGWDGFNSEAIHEAAQSFSIDVDGCPHSYNETKRVSSDGLAIYEIRGAEKDLFRIGAEWIPVVTEP